MIIRFTDFELNLDTCRLVGPDGPVHLEPQVFDCLVYLATNRHRVVTKIELFDEVWGSRYVSESALTTRIKTIRAALGDSGRAQHTVRTAHGRGYQFVAEVTEQPTPPTTPPSSTEPRRPIPATTNRFHGRVQELADLRSKLVDHRLVTVVGPGGTGKTRLSVELAHGLPEDEDAAFLDLVAVRNSGSLGQALAAALGIDAGVEDDVVSACCAYLRSRPMLVVVDNCEHVPAAAAALVRRLLDESSATILATSRIPLGLRDETLFRLNPLPVLDVHRATPAAAADNPAVGLFVDRAERVEHGFTLDDDTVSGVVSLCAALDGLPLALELAAGRLSTFGIDDLVARLDRRLDLLGDEATDTVDRHRTLRATLDWSYALLAPDCQLLFRHLSVFPAGLTLDAIEWLGAQLQLEDDVLTTLDGLVSASLVNRVERPSGSRYVQLETMRTFGLDQLRQNDEHARANDLAATWCLDLLAEQARTLMSAREFHWDDRIRRELPNVRQSRIHMRNEGRIDDLVNVSTNLHNWARYRDVSEIWAWSDELMELDGFDVDATARRGAVAAQAAWRRGRVGEAIELATAALDTGTTDTWALANGLGALGVAHLFSGNLAGAEETWRRHVAIDGDLTDHANAALCRAYGGDPASAAAELAEIRAGAADIDWPSGRAWLHYITGEIESAAGSPDAVSWLESAVDLASEVRASFIIGVAGVTLCTNAAAAGQIESASRRSAELIDHWLRSGTWTQLWTTLRHAASLLAEHAPALALHVLDMADTDPLAPEMEPATRAEFDVLGERLTDAAHGAASPLPSTADRGVVAVAVRDALLASLD